MHRLPKIFILLLVNCILAFPILCIGQKVKLINSTSTGWSGGIAGRYGTSYNFIIEFTHCGKQIPEPDTLWIGNKCIPLVIKSVPGVAYNFIRTVEGKKVIITLFGGTSYADDQKPPLLYPSAPKPPEIIKPSPPFKYGGVALISYKFNGEEKYFIVDKIMSHGQPVNYP